MLDYKKIKSNIVDVSFLIEELGDDVEQISMMIALFLDQSPKKISDLKEAVEKEDFNEVKSISHFLKSSFYIMGLSCKGALREIELLSTNNDDIDKIKKLCTITFKNYYESLLEYKKIYSFINTK